MAKVPFTPSWAKYEKDMRSSDPEKALRATEMFTLEREKEMASSLTARKWEEGRKQEVARDKKGWVKKRIREEQEEKVSAFKYIKQAGSHEESTILPAPGYILVLPDSTNEVTTSAGIIIKSDLPDNSGVCVAVGAKRILDNNNECLMPPCSENDKIFYKLGAGLEIKLGEKNYRFMQFTDVLGIFR